MPSQVFTAAQRQMTLPLDEALVTRTAACAIAWPPGGRRGLKAVAMDLDLSPGNLSVALSDDPHRKFGVDDLERYITEITGGGRPR